MASIHVKEPVPEEENQSGQGPGQPTNTESRVQDDVLQDASVDALSTELSEAQDQKSSSPKQLLLKPTKKQVIVGVVLVIVGVLAFFVSGLIDDRNELREEVTKLSNSGSQTEDEAKKLKEEVGGIIQLPSDELPTVATVVDAEKVKNQAFFANSQNNDKVLLFAKAGKAILYRPSNNKIIEVAPIDLNQNQN